MGAPSYTLLVVIGAIAGSVVSGASSTLFAILVGAMAGFAIAELFRLRQRVHQLQHDLQVLQAALKARLEASAMRREEPAAPPVVVPVPAARPDAALAKAAAAVTPAVMASTIAPPPPVPAPARIPATTAAPGTPNRSSLPEAPPEAPIVRAIREFVTGGNTLVRGGVVILFIGVAFLLRYLAEHSHIPIEFRLSGVALGAVALLVLGWRLRARRSGYALALQGGAVGILYLTVFAALRLYNLMSPSLAFPLLVVLAALSATLAVLQNSQAFALLAVTGGFLAPILASTGQGSHVVLFSYYAVLNAAILGTAWFKSWRPLNLAGFVFTFAIGTAWGVLRYRSELLASTEPFLVLYFVFYVAIAVLYSLRQAPELRGYVDGTLIFGTPLAAFGLQAALLHDRLMSLAYSAALVSAFYLALAWILQRRRGGTQRLLVEAFLALATGFMTLAIPLAFNGQWSAATWAVEGAALVWVGCRQQRKLARAFGALLQLAAGFMIAWHSGISADNWSLPGGLYLSGMLVGAASVFASWLLYARRDTLQDYERGYVIPLLAWGIAWWWFSGADELQRRVTNHYDIAAQACFALVTTLICSELTQRLRYGLARIPALLLLPAITLLFVWSITTLDHPFAYGGWWYWPLAFAGLLVIIRRHEGPVGEATANSLHSVTLWLGLLVLCRETSWQVGRAVALHGAWPAICWGIVPAAALLLLPALTRRIQWPFMVHRHAYLAGAGSGIALYLLAWALAVNFLMDGDSHPLPYAPLLNPLDVTLGFTLLAVALHYQALRIADPAARIASRAHEIGVIAAVAFICLNGELFRALHHLAGIPFTLEAMMSSTLAQTSVTILWSVVALATMTFATRRGIRMAWLCGAGLLAAVVAKLFLVDLSSVGSIERIVSFVAVGLLMLVIGYYAPLPPNAAEKKP